MLGNSGVLMMLMDEVSLILPTEISANFGGRSKARIGGPNPSLVLPYRKVLK